MPNGSLLRLSGTLDPDGDLKVMQCLNENLYCRSGVLMLEFLNHDDDESAIEQLAQEVETNSSRVAKLLLLRSCLPI